MIWKSWSINVFNKLMTLIWISGTLLVPFKSVLRNEMENINIMTDCFVSIWVKFLKIILLNQDWNKIFLVFRFCVDWCKKWSNFPSNHTTMTWGSHLAAINPNVNWCPYYAHLVQITKFPALPPHNIPSQPWHWSHHNVVMFCQDLTTSLL